MHKVMLFIVLAVVPGAAWGNAVQCTAGHYSNGAICTPCPNGSYCVNAARYSCPENYPNSEPGSGNPNDCYLITTAGKYVKVAGGGQEICLAGSYCPGGTKVYFLPYVFVDYITTSEEASINTKLPLSATGYKIKTKMALNDLSGIFGRYYGLINGVMQRYYVGMVNKTELPPIRFEDAWFEYYPRFDYKSFVDGMAHNFDIVHANGVQTMNVDGVQVVAESNTVDPGRIATQFMLPAAENATVYYMQWYDANTDALLKNFIPAYDTTAQTYGMYDTVSNAFFGNGK